MQEPIRIAQMMTDMNYGGVEMVVMNYYRHIDRTKVQFDFFALEGSTIPQREEIEKLGGRVYIVPKYTHLFSYEKAIQKLFRENKYQIVHCHMNTLGVFAMYGAKRAGVPIRILHNHSTAGKGETKKNIVKYLLRPFATLFPTHLCACSQYAGEWIYGRDRKFKVINNAIDIRKFSYNAEQRETLRKELGISDKFVIGHIGRFCYAKNHNLLIDIFAELVKKKEQVVLLLIGEGELEEEIKRKVERLGIDDKVLFLGRRNDTYRYYQAMDVFLLPSRYEGLPVVGIEAQAAGLPCLFSSNVSAEAGILDSTLFMDYEDGVDAWTNKVIELSKTKRKNANDELRKAGFDIEVEAKKLEEMYINLTKECQSLSSY